MNGGRSLLGISAIFVHLYMLRKFAKVPETNDPGIKQLASGATYNQKRERTMETAQTNPGVDIAPRLQLRNLQAINHRSSIAEDVRKGLALRPRWLPPKYFYDDLKFVEINFAL